MGHGLLFIGENVCNYLSFGKTRLGGNMRGGEGVVSCEHDHVDAQPFQLFHSLGAGLFNDVGHTDNPQKLLIF